MKVLGKLTNKMSNKIMTYLSKNKKFNNFILKLINFISLHYYYFCLFYISLLFPFIFIAHITTFFLIEQKNDRSKKLFILYRLNILIAMFILFFIQHYFPVNLCVVVVVQFFFVCLQNSLAACTTVLHWLQHIACFLCPF